MNKIRIQNGTFQENKEITKWVQDNQNKYLCACGCGNYIQMKRVYFRTGITKYIHGHNSIAYRKEISEQVKNFFQTEEGKKRALEHGEFMEEYYKTHESYWKNHPMPKEMIEKQSKTKKERFASGEIIQHQKGKTWKEMYGEEKAEELRKINAKICKGKTGELSPHWKGGKIKIICEVCYKEILVSPCWVKRTKCCSDKCKGIRYSMLGMKCGKNSPTWQGGKSFEPYAPSFNQQLKDKIRVRDNFICQLCKIPEIECNTRLSIHHINYDKLNCKEDNLISLCRKCNAKVNKNRKYWTEFFTSLLEKTHGVKLFI